jgi:hypothetical protein
MQNTYFTAIQRQLSSAKSTPDLQQAIVNAALTDRKTATMLGLGIIVLLVVNPELKTIDRVALSDTSMAAGAQDVSIKPFSEIKIPLHYSENIIARAIDDQKPYRTADWKYLFIPDLPADAARFNQAGAGIGCSVIYPLTGNPKGALIFSYYQEPHDLSKEHDDFMQTYSQLVSAVF